ncbi:MAG TPA: hypothetical protein PLO51_00465 [Candidatus Micrarchaeota archaeon]|nr:hypothetical protein [Candidatus Micrarchaeota archaeon]
MDKGAARGIGLAYADFGAAGLPSAAFEAAALAGAVFGTTGLVLAAFGIEGLAGLGFETWRFATEALIESEEAKDAACLGLARLFWSSSSSA